MPEPVPIQPPPPLRRLQARHRAALAAAAVVLLGHALLLGSWPRAPGPGWRAHAARALQVRQVVPQPATAAVAAIDSAVAAAPSVAPDLRRGAKALPAAAPPPPLALATADTSERPADAVPDPGGEAVPVYATRLPPPVTLQYVVQRGGARAHAELRWQPQDDRYRLSLVSSGPAAFGWTSEGGIDGHGLAPERHGESRRGRELRAVHFQREAGRITFSGPQLEYPLIPGAQDRLSWWLQLASVMAANPSLAAPDSQVLLFVAGTRGDAEVWTFVVAGRDDIELPGGTVAGALHLQREPRRVYDTRVDVWLDPARHHLPVRALLLLRASGEGSEFMLEAASGP